MKLVSDWKRAWRWFSMQAMALAVAGQTAWLNIPPDLKQSIPEDFVTYGTVGLLVLGMVGRIAAQGDE